MIERTEGFAINVGSLVPHGFDSYARVLHPAGSGHPDDRPVTWREIAAATGRVIHPEVQWPHLAFSRDITDINELQDAPPGAPWATAPEEGSLDRELAEVISVVLRSQTSTPDRCWFAVWEGWGNIRPDIRQAPMFELPGRRYYLIRGPLEAATRSIAATDGFHRSASIWWPDDRAWCVATEVDLESTYIGGAAGCVEAVVTHPALEALKVEATHGITWAADAVNPSPLRLD